jgi:hypothetical protein
MAERKQLRNRASVDHLARSNSLAVLAAQIRNEHKQTVAAVRRGLKHAIVCGGLVFEQGADTGAVWSWKLVAVAQETLRYDRPHRPPLQTHRRSWRLRRPSTSTPAEDHAGEVLGLLPGSPGEVAKCTTIACRLWPYLMGWNPFSNRKGKPGGNPEALARARAALRARKA